MLLTYDGFALPYSNVTRFNQESVYDPSGTDKIATRFDVQMQCVLNMAHLQLIQPGEDTLGNFGPDANAATLMVALREKLLRPRRSLSVKVNGQEMIPYPTGGIGTVDVMNGPKPKWCRIIQATSETFLLDYAVEAHYVEELLTPAVRITNRQSQVILYNRWMEAVTIDETGASVRVRTGRFKLRSDNRLGKIPDELRGQFAVLSVPVGFLRQSTKYTQEEDGLTLAYEITDREVFKYPPLGAYRAEGTYREMGRGLGSPMRYAEVDLTLYGPPDNALSDQAALLYKAMQVAAFKLALAGATVINPNLTKEDKNSQAIPREIIAEVDMYNNKVRYRILAWFKGGRRSGRAGVLGLRKTMCQTPYSESDGQQPPYFDRGTADLLLQTAAYFDANLADGPLVRAQITGAGDSVAEGNSEVQISDGPLPGEAGKEKEV